MQPIKPSKETDDGDRPAAGRGAASVRRLSGGPDGDKPGGGKAAANSAHRGRRLRDADRGRSDTMVLVQADPAAGSVRALSFLRDLYVAIPGCGTTRLNAAYSFGGEKLLKTTLKNNFGVEIDRTDDGQLRLPVSYRGRAGRRGAGSDGGGAGAS